MQGRVLNAAAGALVVMMFAAAGLAGCFHGCPDDDKHTFCLRAGNKDCGRVTAKNLCGEVQTITCGECFNDEICGGSGTPNVCSRCQHPAVTKDCSAGWCKVPAGCFWMGAPPDGSCEPFHDPGFGMESRHRVALDHSFTLMETEVLQEDFTRTMGYNPSVNDGIKSPVPAGTPVEHLGWNEAAAYANAMSAAQGLPSCYACSGTGKFSSCSQAAQYAGDQIYECPGFRLPTEAEWEYAYRAGTQADLYLGDIKGCTCTGPPWPKCEAISKIGWWIDNAAGHHHTVKQLLPNGWGLYDMTGNVWEWCHDGYAKDLGQQNQTNPAGDDASPLKSVRGGGFAWGEPQFFRASARRKDTADHHETDVGFRLARTLNP